MDSSKEIQSLLRGVASRLEIDLTDRQREQLAVHFELLIRWASKINLTSLTRPEEIAKRHFEESLYLTKILPSQEVSEEQGVLIDVGTGAGFPGIPLKITWRGLSTILIEPNQKKATFLKEVIRASGIESAEVLAMRLEEAEPTLAGRASLVTVRAVAISQDVLILLQSLLRPGGRLALFIGAEAARGILETSGLEWDNPYPIPGSARRVILVGHRR